MSYNRPQAGQVTAANATFPRGAYTVHATKCSMGTSQSSGAPMLVVEVCILSPEAVPIGDSGVVYKTGGKKGTMYIVGTEKNLSNLVDLAVTTLGLELPPAAATLEEDVKAILNTIAGAFVPTNKFMMTISGKREELTDPVTKEVIKDVHGNPIPGRERIDFNSFSILPNTLSAL